MVLRLPSVILLCSLLIYSKRAKLEKEQRFLNQNKYDRNTHSYFRETESDPVSLNGTSKNYFICTMSFSYVTELAFIRIGILAC